ncbi:MAG: hypothetical protein QW734_08930 [Candidatus Bathyarchaeia archaeon]
MKPILPKAMFIAMKGSEIRFLLDARPFLPNVDRKIALKLLKMKEKLEEINI